MKRPSFVIRRPDSECEGHRRDQLDPLSRSGVGDHQLRGMEHQSVRGLNRLGGRVQIISQNRMSEHAGVNSKLVGPSGVWLESQQGPFGRASSRLYAPAGLG